MSDYRRHVREIKRMGPDVIRAAISELLDPNPHAYLTRDMLEPGRAWPAFLCGLAPEVQREMALILLQAHGGVMVDRVEVTIEDRSRRVTLRMVMEEGRRSVYFVAQGQGAVSMEHMRDYMRERAQAPGPGTLPVLRRVQELRQIADEDRNATLRHHGLQEKEGV